MTSRNYLVYLPTSVDISSTYAIYKRFQFNEHIYEMIECKENKKKITTIIHCKTRSYLTNLGGTRGGGRKGAGGSDIQNSCYNYPDGRMWIVLDQTDYIVEQLLWQIRDKR